MTNERNIPVDGADDDARLRQAYADLAAERSPDHLDRAVLRAAERAARPRYSRLRLWTRPFAWAAMVVLSAAILLQISQQLGPPDASLDRTEFKLERDAPARQRPEPEAAAELREELAKDADMLQQADDLARMQQGPNDLPTAAAAPAAAPAEAMQASAVALQNNSAARSSARFDDEVTGNCGAAARQTPDAWLACIRALEEDGLTEAAELERQLLAEAFPDFEATRTSETNE